MNGSKPSGKLIIFLFAVMLSACAGKEKNVPVLRDEEVEIPLVKADTILPVVPQTGMPIETIHPDSLLSFAKTLLGIPYLYASTDPAKGFDCSGFITYVFNHFGIQVPRSSVDFTNYGKEIELPGSKPGDLILFTGTDSTIRTVGHMGIVESVDLNNGNIYFIHSTSGKGGKGVVITAFENYYRGRFVKVIRVFADKYFE